MVDYDSLDDKDYLINLVQTIYDNNLKNKQ